MKVAAHGQRAANASPVKEPEGACIMKVAAHGQRAAMPHPLRTPEGACIMKVSAHGQCAAASPVKDACGGVFMGDWQVFLFLRVGAL